MNSFDRELIIRAVGQIEGVGLSAKDKSIQDALFCTVDILEAVLRGDAENEKRGAEDTVS